MRRVYWTPDSVDDVVAFYDTKLYCNPPLDENTEPLMICSGGPPEDQQGYGYYTVEISRQSDITSINLYIQWHCGFLDD
jgi:hypothetical protein